MAASSSPSGAMNRPKAGPLVTAWLPVQSAFTVYVKGVTKFSSTTVVPIRTLSAWPHCTLAFAIRGSERGR
jgi:hypothetical protein